MLDDGVATTTYGYDAFGQRVIQTGTSTTYLYPFKWYSIASSTGTGAKYATTTSYMFNGDTLVATVDQQTASGVATGTAQTRYIHPDHLGSTNVVTDQNDNVVQTLDYYPYGATRVSVATSTNEKRKYIDQFADDSGLSYLNARYYNSAQGQFSSEDPVFSIQNSKLCKIHKASTLIHTRWTIQLPRKTPLDSPSVLMISPVCHSEASSDLISTLSRLGLQISR